MKESFFIWIVTDENPLATLLECVLKKGGYAVTLLENGLAAQKKIKQETIPPHVILISLNLPFVDGFQLTQQIRQKKKLAECSYYRAKS